MRHYQEMTLVSDDVEDLDALVLAVEQAPDAVA
jgi:hypothetical protein